MCIRDSRGRPRTAPQPPRDGTGGSQAAAGPAQEETRPSPARHLDNARGTLATCVPSGAGR
eukprot:4097035-Pyramimonas_sp.AAC.1